MAHVRRSSKILLCFVSVVGFLETNLVILVAIEVQKDQTTSFLRPRNPQITLVKEKEMKKWEEQGEKRRMSKNAGVAIWDFLEIVFAPKNYLTEEVYFKNPARCDLYCLYRDIEYDLSTGYP